MPENSVFVTRHLEGNENVACLSAVRGPDSTNTGGEGVKGWRGEGVRDEEE